MYADPPDFTSAKGAAAWAKFAPPVGDTMLVQTQWLTIVRKFLTAAKGVVPPYFAIDRATGKCYGGDSLSAIPSAQRQYVHRYENISGDDPWGETANDLLAFLLCISGQPTLAKKTAGWRALIAKGQLRIPMDVLKWLLAFSAVPIQGNVGTAQAPHVGTNVSMVAKYIDLPASTILPMWKSSVTVKEDPRDAGWFSISKLSDPAPKPPSMTVADPTAPVQVPPPPPPPAGANRPAGSSSALPLIVGAGIVAWFLLR